LLPACNVVASPINKNEFVCRWAGKVFKFDGRQQAVNVISHSMKNFISAIAILFLFGCSNSQSTNDAGYSKEICECLDSLSKPADVEHNFPICFSILLDKNSSALTKEVIKTYGSFNKENVAKFTDRLEIRLSVNLFDSCTAFFKFTDSLKHQQYKNLSKDSLTRLLGGLESIDSTKRSKNYYVSASTLHFQLGEYEKAMENVDKVLSEDSLNVSALFIKAFIFDVKGNYQDAIALYDKAARLSHQDGFYIYSALARRKKNGL
jgi:tetratricopeptide (TPR) repeat protein